jgi:hypothetical protein
MNFQCLSLCVWILLVGITYAENATVFPKRTMVEKEGWKIHISQKLLESEKEATNRALELLVPQLQEIKKVVPAVAVKKLQTVPLWFTEEYANVQPRAEYHPGAGWLKENKRDPIMVNGVEFTNIRIFEKETKRMPNFALHELAHAYHDLFLEKGFKNNPIKDLYEAAKASGKYDKVEQRFGDGRSATVKHYAMTTPQEYFAEGSEAFFTTNDFFPFHKEQLRLHDPALYTLLEKLWNQPSR